MKEKEPLCINAQVTIAKPWNTPGAQLVGVKFYLDQDTIKRVFEMFWNQAMAAGLSMKGL